MLLRKIKKLPIVLGSQSPRRNDLLKSLDIDFQVIVKSIDESISDDVSPEDAAECIALKKLKAFESPEFENHLIITADTVVVDLAGRVLGKPASAEEAKGILKDLSGDVHYVYTGVGILFNGVVKSFTCKTEVVFNPLATEEIDYYIDTYKPFDKAGSYGIQEWIGRTAIERINGSYENVMGLPTSRLYQELKKIEEGL